MTEHILINSTAPRIAYVADGVQSAFTFPFAIFKPEDLEAWLDDTVISSGFSVSGAGVSTGGTAIFAVPPPAGTRVTLRRRMEIARTSDFQADGVIRAKTINDELDRQIAALQQVADDVGRCVARAVTSASPADLTLPEPAPGKALGWNADGTALVNDPADFAATAATIAAQAAQALSAATIAQAAETEASAASAVAVAARNAAALSADAAAERAAAADVARIEWKGAWSAATAYAVNDAVSHGGASWICTAAHTNQAPADNAWWDPLAAKGIDGTGIGDLIAANNLSDIANPATARSNLGLEIGSDIQAHDSDLDWLAANITAAGKALLDDADAAAQRVTLGAAAASHTHAAADLGSGSASSSTYLRGDQTWATVPAGALEYVASATLTGSEVTVSGLASGYDYIVAATNVQTNRGGFSDTLYVRCNSDATSGNYFGLINGCVSGGSAIALDNSSGGLIVGSFNNSSPYGQSFTVTLFDVGGTTRKAHQTIFVGQDNSGAAYAGAGGGIWNSTAAITSVTFYCKNGGTFDAGTLIIYRRKRSA